MKAVRLGTPLDAADLVLVLVKAWQTDRVAREVPALTARDGHVLTLQNGLGNVEKLGPRHFLGVTEQGATLVAPGRVRPAATAPRTSPARSPSPRCFAPRVSTRAPSIPLSAPRSRGESSP